MKALIFGINGQDGFYLNQLLLKKNIKVLGVSRKEGNWTKGDVGNYKLVGELIKNNKPDYIFHLAANSITQHNALFENHETIETGTLNILEATYRHSPQSKVFLSGSAVQFKNIGKPINEDTPFSALSPYAVSRIASVYAGRYYRTLGVNVYVGYFFNHDSPLRTERHINQKIIKGIKRIIQGSNDVIEIGDMHTKKEFNYAGDVVEAVWLLVNQEKYCEAVIGSGKAYSIKDWIEICFGMAGLDWKKFITEKIGYHPEYKILVSDPCRMHSIGYMPRVNIKSLARLMYDNA